MSESEHPKLFISYSWSNLQHKAWVLELATKLAENGVHPILDEWDLKPGGDAHRFMERIVTDNTIRKVILICDKVYAEKADARAGGVGTEAQILTPELYGEGDESKFVAVISETDGDGKPYLPTFYRSRIYINLSSDDSYAEEFESLLRWIHDKPRHQRPPIGPRPIYLDDESTGIRLATSAALRRCEDAIRNSKSHAIPALEDYLEILTREMEKFRIARGNEPDQTPFDEKIFDSIEQFRPYKIELVGIFVLIARYLDNDECRERIHRFFGLLLPYTRRPPSVLHYNEWDYDNYRMIVHELLLHYIAVQVRFERFSSIQKFLEKPFYVEHHPDVGPADMQPFTMFCFGFDSLQYRAQRLHKDLSGFYASILRTRCEGTGTLFSHLMTADLIMFLRGQNTSDRGAMWWPHTLERLSYRIESPEIFVRASSQSYFDRIKGMIGVRDKAEMEALVVRVEAVPHFYQAMFSRTSLRQFMRVNEIATRI